MVEQHALNNQISSEAPTSTPLAQRTRGASVMQIAGLMMVFALMIGGYVRAQTGSWELVRPWLQGHSLVFLPQEVDLGAVAADQLVARHMRVVNLLSKPITLTGSQQSCGCIALNEFPLVVPPGETCQINLKIKMGSQAGSFEQMIKIFTDHRGHTAVPIKILADIQ